jgi:hypothetical protein
MNSTLTSTFAVTKLNLRNIGPAYWITGVTVAAMLVDLIVMAILLACGIDVGGDQMGMGQWFWLLPVLAPVLIASLHFRRVINLGGTRTAYLRGAAITYVIMAAAVSLADLIFYYAFDRVMVRTGVFTNTLSAQDAFGWRGHNPVTAFCQEFAFLLLVAVFVHTLTALQDRWYGWVTDIVIIAIISVFTPIAALRGAELWFFRMICFHPLAWVQILSCLILSVVIYALNRPIYAAKVA